MGLKRDKEATPAFETAIRLAPSNSAALNNLAWLMREVDLKKALEYAGRATHEAPNNPLITDTYAMLLLQDGNAARAVELLQGAKGKAPQVPVIGYHLAVALVKQGELAKARKELEEVLKEPRPFAEKTQAEALLKELKGS